MRLYVIYAAILAVSLAKEIGNKDELEDLEAQASSIELLKTDREDKESLNTAASTYNNNYVPPSQRPPRPWTQPQNYVPNNPPQNPLYTQVNPPQYTNNYAPTPVNNQNYVPSVPVQNDYQQNYPDFPRPIPANPVPAPTYPENNYVNKPFNNYPTQPPTNIYPTQNYPTQNYPTQNYPTQNYPTVPPQNYIPQNPIPQNPIPQNPIPQQPQQPVNSQTPQNDYYYPAVIKNEQYFGDDGKYNYEYQIADGTHVGESGYIINPNTDNQSVVKKGWYSYTGGDGRVYTVTWYADDTGYHAFGDHLPTPPPVPAAIQAALDQAAKDEANKNKPQNPTYYPTTPAPVYYPTQPAYYPTQPAYYPSQQQYYPQQQQTYYPPSYGK